jgi:hypothetical protein
MQVPAPQKILPPATFGVRFEYASNLRNPSAQMLQSNHGHSSGLSAPNCAVVTKLLALRPGGTLTLIGLGQAQLAELLSRTSSAPCILRLDFVGVVTTALAIADS